MTGILFLHGYKTASGSTKNKFVDFTATGKYLFPYMALGWRHLLEIRLENTCRGLKLDCDFVGMRS